MQTAITHNRIHHEDKLGVCYSTPLGLVLREIVHAL
jgi:hypothetical protein